MKYIGIWTERKPNLYQLREEGFNALFIRIGWFWDEINEDDIEKKEHETVSRMFRFFQDAKEYGFEWFIIDGSWGLGTYNGTFLFQKIVAKFEAEPSIYFYHGEPYEGLVESNFCPFRSMLEILDEKLAADERFVFDVTVRNFKLVIPNFSPGTFTFSSYWKQDKHWFTLLPWIWIYGQLNWHSPHSLRFKRLLGVATARSIDTAMLYQADPAKWDWINFGVKILDVLGLRDWFERWQRKRFVKWCRRWN